MGFNFCMPLIKSHFEFWPTTTNMMEPHETFLSTIISRSRCLSCLFLCFFGVVCGEKQIKMKKGTSYGRWVLIAAVTLVLNHLFTSTSHCCCLARTIKGGHSSEGGPTGVTLHVTDKYVVMDNGILQVKIAVPEGFVTGIQFNGLENLLETFNEEPNRGYWDVVWDVPEVRCGRDGCTDWVLGSNFSIIHNSENQAEISFMHKWNPDSSNYQEVPLNVDRRYVMLHGYSGFYSYAIFEREAGWPEANIFQIRAVYKLHRDSFHYMALSDQRQRIMPMPEDRLRGMPLDYKEAVLLTDPINPDLRGEVDDKYQYSCDDRDNKVHGWVSSNPSVGFWMITPSNEFRSAGPLKQDLTSHTGPITLAMFHSAHYAGQALTMKFEKGEPWKKVYGPFFVYLNTATGDNDPNVLWKDAKRQMTEETRKWPYVFPLSDDFPKSNQRGVVSGRLLVHDRYIKAAPIFGTNAWVGLALPGEVGSWQSESKGYQFWTKADEDGKFEIKEIREGKYSLYAFVPGFIGEYKHPEHITITPGRNIRLDDLIYKPPRSGPTLWEIGFPDRTAAEFYIPQPNVLRLNRLYVRNNQNRFRQYGLWERYSELYPEEDLVYNVDQNDYHNDWFFAHVTRIRENGTIHPTTWQVIFHLENEVDQDASYTLRLAIASATVAEVQVRFNDRNTEVPHFTTMLFGRDNAIARHGIHGLYWLFNVPVKGSWLLRGQNTMYLTQTRSLTKFEGVMYDYLRLEGPVVQS